MAFAPAVWMMIATAASGAVSAYSSIQQGKAAEAQGKYNAAVVRNNAVQDKYDALTREQTANSNSDAALLEANENKRRALRKAKTSEARGIAQLSRQGLNISSVSFSDSLRSQLVLDEAEGAAALFQGAQESAAHRRQGLGARIAGDRALSLAPSQASAFIASGKNQKRASQLSAIGTGLSTGAKIGGQGIDAGFWG